MFGSESWPKNRKFLEKKPDMTDMRMLRCLMEETKSSKMRYDTIWKMANMVVA